MNCIFLHRETLPYQISNLVYVIDYIEEQFGFDELNHFCSVPYCSVLKRVTEILVSGCWTYSFPIGVTGDPPSNALSLVIPIVARNIE